MGIQLNAPIRAAASVNQVFNDLTNNERCVYDTLCNSEKPQKAYDLLSILQDHGLRAPMTIYRALDALVAKGYVKKIETLNAFIAVHRSHGEHISAFLICKECKQAKEIPLDEGQVADLFSPLQVATGNIRIEAFGDCEQVCSG